MSRPLIIVESPAKAKTISRFLGNGAVVESSIGHIRDLPSGADEIPDAYKKKAWARTGVDVEHGFVPLYVVPGDKKAQVKKLKDLLADASALYLATDEDREGEAIAWHLNEVLKPKVPVQRMVFHEITEKAIKHAIANPRAIDAKLVDAQEARRILDRLYGYEVSPVLWRKIAPRLSAGRVQSVATRLIVERERLRLAFRSGSYYGLTAVVQPRTSELTIATEVVELFGRRIATSKDFDASTGALGEAAQKAQVLQVGQALAEAVARALPDAATAVTDVVKKPFTQKPYAPFITSSLQQEAARKLRFTAQRTMRTAQRLYESGFITYMRTDSVTLSAEALAAARTQVEELFGAEFLPDAPRVYTKQVKGAQEAHEAIRPAGDAFRTPESVRDQLEEDQWKLYDLIWKRTVASQMKDATGERTQVRMQADLPGGIAGAPAGPARAVLTASGKVLHFPGFLRAYVEGTDDPDAELEDQEKLLPPLATGDAVVTRSAEAKERTTQPPFRFTEASLVKELEDRGIGRPSTYASIIQTIQDRGYVFKKGGALVPTLTAFAVTNLLETHFGELVDYAFTAKMEDDLDFISSGEKQSRPWLSQFFFGDAGPRPIEKWEAGGERTNGTSSPGPLAQVGLHAKIGEGVSGIDPRGICALPIGFTPDGEAIVARVGRYGPYVQIGDTDRRANLPVELPVDELTVAKALDLLAQSAGSNRSVGDDPKTGLPIFVKVGRFGPYIQLGEQQLDAKGKRKKDSNVRMASLWPGMRPETLTLEQALQLLSYPKVLGQHPETGGDVIASDGQYGPYVFTMNGDKRDSRSLAGHDALRAVTLADALALLAEPRVFGRKGGGQNAGVSLGTSPITGKPVAVKKGKFGVYVTDGQVNATVPSTKDPTALSLEEALELIALREEKMREQGKDPRATITPTGTKANRRPARKAAPAADEAPKPSAKKPAAAKKPEPKKPEPAKKPDAKKSAAAKKPAAKPAKKPAAKKKPAGKKR